MASKKCPKCGEDNPAEAVMCWACYTPLSGAPAMAVPGMTGAPGMASGAGVAARTQGGAGNAVGVPPGADDGTAKKGVDPKLIGGGAFLVVAGLVAFLVSSSMSGPATTDAPVNPPVADPPVFIPPPPPQNNGGGLAPPPPSNSAPPPIANLPFTLVTPPNPKFATGTAAVVAVNRNLSPTQGAGVARLAYAQLARGGKWTSMQILVFADQQGAQAFSAWQNKRQGAPLQGSDFQSLAGQGVWSSTIAYLDVRGRKERPFYPSSSPNSWWGSIGR